jgi:putative ABC transport system permease protein
VIRYSLAALRARLKSGRSLFLLTVLGVALGIASVLSIQIINRSALGAFRGSVQAVSGDADLSVVPLMPVLPESLYAAVLADREVRQAWPILEVTAAVDGRDKYYLDIIGTDLLALASTPWAGTADNPGDVLSRRGWAAVTPELAAELGIARGDTLGISSGSRRARLLIGALVDFRRVAPLASRKIVVMDIAQVQTLLAGRGELTQIDIMLTPGASAPDAARRLKARLGPAVDILTPKQREERAEGLMAAFKLNLSALSLISLVVGFFLVHNATQASLVRRRTEFGILRSMGATRSQVLTFILAEVGLLGLLGVAVGLPLGWLAARANLAMVSATISNLYLLNEIEHLDVPLTLWVLAALLGIVSAALGALGPARELSTSDVKDLLAPITLHERTGENAHRYLAAGLGVLGITGAWYVLLGRHWQPAGFVLAVALLLAIPLFTPWLLQQTSRRLTVRSFGLAYSFQSLGVRLQTTSFAIASLAIAVAMLVGITVMVGSFRRTVTLWIGDTLRADVYITTPSWRGAGGQGTLDSALVAAIAALPGVRAVDRLRGFQGYVDGRRVGVAGVDFGLTHGEERFKMFAGEPVAALRAVRDSGAVIITEPLARKTGLTVGGMLPLMTPGGERRFRVAGVNYDYSSENGAVVMDLTTLQAAFGPGPLNSIALYLEPDQDPERIIDLVRARLPGAPLNMRSNRSLRTEVLNVFDQTFAVTRLLQVLALLVAASGITLTLLILARERAPELAVYRALGAQRSQLFRFFVGKGLGIGVFGLVLGAVGGAALAAVLILVINRAYFGWTIQVSWPFGPLTGAAATILAAAVLASLYPAARASRSPATELSRDDL